MSGGRRVELRIVLTIEADWADEDVARMVSGLGQSLAREAFEDFGPDAWGGYVGPQLVDWPKWGAEVAGQWLHGVAYGAEGVTPGE